MRHVNPEPEPCKMHIKCSAHPGIDLGPNVEASIMCNAMVLRCRVQFWYRAHQTDLGRSLVMMSAPTVGGSQCFLHYLGAASSHKLPFAETCGLLLSFTFQVYGFGAGASLGINP